MKTWQAFSRLLKDRSGNFGMMTAIMLPVLLGAGGVALDVTNMMISKNQLQDAADAASLAASTALANGEAANNAAAKRIAQEFFIGQLTNSMDSETANAIGNAAKIDVTTTTNKNGKGFEVRVGTNYDLALTPLMGVLGYQTMDIGVKSVSTSGTSNKRGGISMYLALDRSGSMSFKTESTKAGECKNFTEKNWGRRNYLEKSKPCHIRKIEALQTASYALLASLKAIDPQNNLVRMGASSYTDETQNEKAMNWGTDHVKQYVQQLPYEPLGGTDASGAMTNAYNALTTKPGKNGKKLNSEAEEHDSKENDEFQRNILLMTDGKMTGDSADFDPSIDKAVRKQCKAAKDDGITIYTVAFMAPKEGKELLQYCASTPEHYFQPDSLAGIIAAFDAIGKKAAKEGTVLTN